MKSVHCQSRCLPRCLLSTYNVRKEMQVHTYSHAVQTCIQCLMSFSVSLRKLPPDHAPERGNPSSAWHQLRTQLLQRICLASGGYRAPCDSIHDYMIMANASGSCGSQMRVNSAASMRRFLAGARAGTAIVERRASLGTYWSATRKANSSLAYRNATQALRYELKACCRTVLHN